MAGAELVTLFGNELDEVGKARMGGLKVVGSEKVSYRDVCQMLLAMAVAELVSSRAATLTEEDVKGRFRSRRALMLRASGDAAGFTGLVAQAAVGGVEVRDLVLRMLGNQVASPDSVLVTRAHATLDGTGAVVKAGGMGKKLGAKLGMSSYEVDDQGAQALRPEWERLRSTWREWSSANPALAKQLLDSCKDAVGRAKSGE